MNSRAVPMIPDVQKEEFPATSPAFEEFETMHELLIALAFVGMVVAPAIVAAKSSKGKPTDEGE